jgi:hydrogenase-4 component E
LSDTVSVQLLDLACGAFLLAAVLMLWRRELAAIIGLFAAQGVALASLVAVLGLREAHRELLAVAAGVAALPAVVNLFDVSPPAVSRP